MMIDLMIGIALAACIILITRIKKALTWSAAFLAAGMLIFISCLSGFWQAVFLVGMYMAVFLVDMFLGTKMEQATKGIHEKGDIRNHKQILANGSAGCICILLYKIWGEPAFLIGYYASIYEVMADSIASDVGVLSKKAPRDICTWKKVSRGISGGVSVLGILASVIACSCAGILTGMVLKWDGLVVLVVAAAAYLGMIADSVIGSIFQEKYSCTVCGMQTEKKIHCGKKTVVSGGMRNISNNVVNFICTVLSSLFAYLLTILV